MHDCWCTSITMSAPCYRAISSWWKVVAGVTNCGPALVRVRDRHHDVGAFTRSADGAALVTHGIPLRLSDGFVHIPLALLTS
jgi:hypothetical protein